MAVKITQNGIDTLQDNVVSASKIIDGSISYDDLPEGTIIQAESILYTTRTSYTCLTSDTDVPGMSITITPNLSNSKFMIIVRHWCEFADGWNSMFNIKRDGTRLHALTNNHWDGLTTAALSYGGAVDNNSTPEMVNITTLDTLGSTAGVPINYRLVSSSSANRTVWVNRTFGSDGTTNYENSTSEMIVLEFKGY